MRFVVPGHAVEFEIPDEWWDAAGMQDFAPKTEAYAAEEDPHEPSRPVPFSEILPPHRSAGTPMFKRDRMIQILEAIRASTRLPPISINGPVPGSEVPYAVRDGMHRYHAAAAAGFHSVPALVWSYWVPEE